MKSRFLLLASLIVFVACNQDAETKTLSVGLNASDEEKIAYLFGFQMGTQVFKNVPRQVGEGLSEDALLQGFKDAIQKESDSTKALQLSEANLQNIGQIYSERAQARFRAIRPDSATGASMTPPQIQAYMDSLSKLQPVAPEPEIKGASVKLDSTSPEVIRFSYMFGVNFHAQFQTISLQSGLSLSQKSFQSGLKDGHRAAKDSTYRGLFSEDSIKVIGERFAEYSKKQREKAVEEARKEEERVKAEIAPLRGDTLPDGMPAKMNFEVKLEGVTVSGENLKAYMGKPLLVFYFSPTCGHCRHAAPEVEKFAAEFKDQGLLTVAIASSGHPKKNIRQFVEDVKMDLPVFQDAARQFGELYSDGYVPKVYLVNPDASYKIYRSFEKEQDSLRTDILSLLKK